MDNIKIKVYDGHPQKFNFPDISYERFCQFMCHSGISDQEYKEYLWKYNMICLLDFNSETTEDVSLEFSRGDRVLKFRCIYDSDNDEDKEENNMEDTMRFDPTQHEGTPLNCDQVSHLLQTFDRYLPKNNDPAICRRREMLKYAMLYEVMEILTLSLEDEAARYNATPSDIRK